MRNFQRSRAATYLESRYDLSQDNDVEVGFRRIPNPTIHDRFVLRWHRIETADPGDRSFQWSSAGPGKANI
jgi:hypothetical protein